MRRSGHYYEGDLLGAGALAALLLAIPFVRPEASWLAGVVGGASACSSGWGCRAPSTSACDGSDASSGRPRREG